MEAEAIREMSVVRLERHPVMSRAAVERSAGAELVDAVRSGDRDAFGRLYRLFSPLVHGVVLARVPVDDVDDIVQDVFVTALDRLDALRDTTAFGPWIAAIARNRAMDFHRHRPRAEELTDDIPAAGSSADASEAARALAAIRALPEAYRETLVLRLVEGLTGPEIAERTGLTPASVRVNLHRGMKQLRERLGLGGIGE